MSLSYRPRSQGIGSWRDGSIHKHLVGKQAGAGEVAQFITHLVGKHEDLSLIPSSQVKDLGMVMWTIIPALAR